MPEQVRSSLNPWIAGFVGLTPAEAGWLTSAVQLGFLDKKRRNATQAERGHAKKADAEPKRFIREIRQEAPAEGVAWQRDLAGT